MKPLKSDFDYWSDPNQFPLRYPYFGTNYVVKYDDFAPALMQFYNAYAELNTLNGGPAEESYRFHEKVTASTYASAWDKYVAYDKMAAYETNHDPGAARLPATLLNQLRAYGKLSERDKQTVADKRLPDAKDLGAKILALCQRTPAIANRGAVAGDRPPALLHLEPLGDLLVRREEALATRVARRAQCGEPDDRMRIVHHRAQLRAVAQEAQLHADARVEAAAPRKPRARRVRAEAAERARERARVAEHPEELALVERRQGAVEPGGRSEGLGAREGRPLRRLHAGNAPTFLVDQDRQVRPSR